MVGDAAAAETAAAEAQAGAEAAVEAQIAAERQLREAAEAQASEADAVRTHSDIQNLCNNAFAHLPGC